jgi:hypothetical protein
MLIAFLSILAHLKYDKDVVSRLWRSFWTALQRGLGGEVTLSEDRLAIEEVGRILGAQRAIKEQEATAMALFEKAKMGLEPGTEREAWFSNEYVAAMVRQEKANQASR